MFVKVWLGGLFLTMRPHADRYQQTSLQWERRHSRRVPIRYSIFTYDSICHNSKFLLAYSGHNLGSVQFLNVVEYALAMEHTKCGNDRTLRLSIPCSLKTHPYSQESPCFHLNLSRASLNASASLRTTSSFSALVTILQKLDISRMAVMQCPLYIISNHHTRALVCRA